MRFLPLGVPSSATSLAVPTCAPLMCSVCFPSPWAGDRAPHGPYEGRAHGSAALQGAGCWSFERAATGEGEGGGEGRGGGRGRARERALGASSTSRCRPRRSQAVCQELQALLHELP